MLKCRCGTTEPSVLVKGGDYNGQKVIGEDLVDELKLVDFIDEKSLSSIINANISLQNDQIFILVSNVLKVININDWSLKRIPLPNYNLSYNRIKVLNEKAYFSFSNGIVELNLSDNTFEKFEYDDLFNNQFPRGFSDIEIIDDEIWVSNLESGLHSFNVSLN